MANSAQIVERLLVDALEEMEEAYDRRPNENVPLEVKITLKFRDSHRGEGINIKAGISFLSGKKFADKFEVDIDPCQQKMEFGA